MTKILATARALPPFDVSQDTAKDFAGKHFEGKLEDIESLLAVYDHSRIDFRQFCVPPEWFMNPHSFSEKNATYVDWAVKLGAEAANKCLAKANVDAGEIDHIIFVSSTGIATPSIDARLFNILHFRADIRRTPIWGLGCVGGACGLAYANDYIKAYPNAKVLLVAVELCGLTFHYEDYSRSNFVAIALFGDGAAAVLLSGEGGGPTIIDQRATTWPDSLNVMGWNVVDEGLQVVFAQAIPRLVTTNSRNDIDSFLKQTDCQISDIDYFLIHPGGARVIDAYKKALDLQDDQLKYSEEILGRHGNMSSVTVLYILDRVLEEKMPEGKYGLLTALGPGFSSQNILLRG
jgi:alkylresorcinol/alkylpyrone synthase